MNQNQEQLLEQLTGVNSSKLNYYVELKQRNAEILQQNSRLEILHQLAHDMNIDLSLEEILDRALAKLPGALPCDFLGLVSRVNDQALLQDMAPQGFLAAGLLADDSSPNQVMLSGKAAIFASGESGGLHLPSRQGASAAPLRSLAIAPMIEHARVTGALLVGSIRTGVFGNSELSFVQHLADQLAISIQNARLYEQVSLARKKWEATFQAVTDPIVLIDTDYNLLLHNDRLPDELLQVWLRTRGDKCHRRFYDRQEPCPECPVEEIKRQPRAFHHRNQIPGGGLFDMSYYPVFNDEKQLVAITVIMKDVTEKTRLEAQLVHSARLAAIGEMAAGVAHEINSPMTVIIGTAQMLARDLAGRDSESLNDIIQSGLRCKRIIQNLLTFSRQDQAPMSATDLNAEIRQVLKMISYQINRSQIRIVDALDPGLPPVLANGQQIQQVLTNFLVNARDALNGLEDRQKTIIVASQRVEKDGRPWVCVSVQDNGIGIPEASRPKIFTPFFTSKETTKGTGLGLSVSLGIAQTHDGTIEFTSEPGAGSVFTLLIPADRATGPVSAETRSP